MPFACSWESRGLICNDGSPAGYYTRLADETDSDEVKNKWVIYLEVRNRRVIYLVVRNK